MRKASAFLLCVAIVFSLVACENNVAFTEDENGRIVSKDGVEYVYVDYINDVWCFGEWEFIGHVKGEKKEFDHLSDLSQTGMYSVNGSRDVLVRYFPENEFPVLYVKPELLKTEVSLDSCIRFAFVEDLSVYDEKTILPKGGITECELFLNEITSGQTAEEAGFLNFVTQPNGSYKNYLLYGYACGVIQEDLNLVIPLEIWSFDGKAYSIKINGVEYALSEEWLDKLLVE